MNPAEKGRSPSVQESLHGVGAHPYVLGNNWVGDCTLPPAFNGSICIHSVITILLTKIHDDATYLIQG